MAVKREDGFHLDLEDYLTGLLYLAGDLVSKWDIGLFDKARLNFLTIDILGPFRCQLCHLWRI